MRARGSGFLYAVMLAAALAGRAFDAGGLLPGVREAAMVRAAEAGWLTAAGAALLVAAVASRRWSRTGDLRATGAVVAAGQLATFFAAEAVVRVASGLAPLDADGLVGAGLQASLGLLLLLTVTAAWLVALGTAPLRLGQPPVGDEPHLRRTTQVRSSGPLRLLVARGPPLGAGT